MNHLLKFKYRKLLTVGVAAVNITGYKTYNDTADLKHTTDVTIKNSEIRDSDCLDDNESKEPNWAYPHPYDFSIEKERFLDSSGEKYRKVEDTYNLKELVALWEETDGEETWPWVWCLRNPVGPHHLFIGVSKNTLELMSKVAKESVNNNLTIIVNSIDEIEKFGPIQDYFDCRCGVIEVPVKQTDIKNKIIMLRDERIICFDHAYIS